MPEIWPHFYTEMAWRSIILHLNFQKFLGTTLEFRSLSVVGLSQVLHYSSLYSGENLWKVRFWAWSEKEKEWWCHDEDALQFKSPNS